MKRTLIAAVLTALFAHAAHAAIDRAESGNGELFLAVNNPVAQVSYIFDTGIRLETFIASGETPGYAPSFNLGGDAAWQQFLSAMTAGGGTLANTTWAVLAFDSTGGAGAGFQRLLTTARQEAAGFEATVARIGTTSNNQFSSGVNSANVQSFFNTVNVTGTHGTLGTAPDYSINGSSFNPASEPGCAYFTRPQCLTENLNNFAQWNNTNLVGQRSGFYYVTRSSTSNLASARVLVDPFLSPEGVYATWGFDGTTLAYAVPEPGTYGMLAVGLLAVGAVVRRRQQRQA